MPEHWIQTYSGRAFFPLVPSPLDVDIFDIAHALSMKCRFGGHVKMFYSVAEHSVLVSREVPPPYKLAALLHDAAEAYLADIPRPVKPHLPGFAGIEDAVEKAIAAHFGIEWPWPDAVKAVDNAILHDERRLAMKPSEHDWGLTGEGLGLAFLPFWNPAYAERQFLRAYSEITGVVALDGAGWPLVGDHTGWAG